SSRRRHTRFSRDWSSDVCSSDLERVRVACGAVQRLLAAAHPHRQPLLHGTRRELEATQIPDLARFLDALTVPELTEPAHRLIHADRKSVVRERVQMASAPGALKL